jgi:hypothetical protein
MKSTSMNINCLNTPVSITLYDVRHGQEKLYFLAVTLIFTNLNEPLLLEFIIIIIPCNTLLHYSNLLRMVHCSKFKRIAMVFECIEKCNISVGKTNKKNNKNQNNKRNKKNGIISV